MSESTEIKGDGVTKMNTKNFAMVIFFTFLPHAMAGQSVWVFSVDEKDRPITACIELNRDSYSLALLQMGCKNKLFASIHLCQNKKILTVTESQKDCEKSRLELSSKNGESPISK